MKNRNGMKILLFDIETAPSWGCIWQLHREIHSYKNIDKDWYILCWAAKWLNGKKIYTSAIPRFKGWKKNPENDKKVLIELKKMLDEADVVVAHNGKKFDQKKINTRFIYHGILPPSPYKMVDTLSIARSSFAFTSNKLDDIAHYLGLSRKDGHEGLSLWKKCMLGQKTAWRKMVQYCRQDVRVLEELYLKLRPWITNHPNAGNYIDDMDGNVPICKNCGSSNLIKEGFSYTGNMSKFQRYQCKNCGAWGRGRKNFNSKEKKKRIVMAAK